MNAVLNNDKASIAPVSATSWLVLYAGGLPLLFPKNLCNQVFSIVSIERATRFVSEAAARQEAVRSGVKHFSVVLEEDV